MCFIALLCQWQNSRIKISHTSFQSALMVNNKCSWKNLTLRPRELLLCNNLRLRKDRKYIKKIGRQKMKAQLNFCFNKHFLTLLLLFRFFFNRRLTFIHHYAYNLHITSDKHSYCRRLSVKPDAYCIVLYSIIEI